MAIKVSKRFLARARPALKRYQKVVADAHARDVNESDTAVIVADFLSAVLGYDKYKEITSEFEIRSTYCDLAITCEGRLCYLIEVKSIGTELKDAHIRQAVDYGSKQGCEWVLLTNGARWQAYRIRYEKPVDYDLTFELDLLSATPPAELLPMLFLVARESSKGKEIDRFWRQKQATSRYVIAQLLLQDKPLALLRRELRQLSADVRISCEEIARIMATEIIKRDALEGEEAASALSTIRRAQRRRSRSKGDRVERKDPVPPAVKTTASPPSSKPAAAAPATG
jgi:predicted type IV restriction endonuclease